MATLQRGYLLTQLIPPRTLLGKLYTIAKNKIITIRLSEKNLINVKAAADREGLSYQTFISALIHKNT